MRAVARFTHRRRRRLESSGLHGPVGEVAAGRRGAGGPDRRGGERADGRELVHGHLGARWMRARPCPRERRFRARRTTSVQRPHRRRRTCSSTTTPSSIVREASRPCWQALSRSGSRDRGAQAAERGLVAPAERRSAHDAAACAGPGQWSQPPRSGSLAASAQHALEPFVVPRGRGGDGAGDARRRLRSGTCSAVSPRRASCTRKISIFAGVPANEGWKTWFAGEAEFVHLGGASSDRRWSTRERSERVGRAEAEMIRDTPRPGAGRCCPRNHAAGARRPSRLFRPDRGTSKRQRAAAARSRAWAGVAGRCLRRRRSVPPRSRSFGPTVEASRGSARGRDGALDRLPGGPGRPVRPEQVVRGIGRWLRPGVDEAARDDRPPLCHRPGQRLSHVLGLNLLADRVMVAGVRAPAELGDPDRFFGAGLAGPGSG